MLVHHTVVNAAIHNGSDEIARRSSPPGERFTRVREVVALLNEGCHPRTFQGARDRLGEMQAGAWEVHRGVHVSASDAMPHVTIRVAGVRWHLRVDESLRVREITRRDGNGATIRAPIRETWQAPGTQCSIMVGRVILLPRAWLKVHHPEIDLDKPYTPRR